MPGRHVRHNPAPPHTPRRYEARSLMLVAHSRQVRVAGIARAERVCLDSGTVRSRAVQASLGVDCRPDPPRSAISRQLASPAGGPVVLRVRHGGEAFSWRVFNPVRASLSGPRGREEARTPTPSINRGRVAPKRWHRAGGAPVTDVDSGERERLRRWVRGPIFDRARATMLRARLQLRTAAASRHRPRTAAYWSLSSGLILEAIDVSPGGQAAIRLARPYRRVRRGRGALEHWMQSRPVENWRAGRRC